MDELKNYPDTEHSRLLASAVRATLNAAPALAESAGLNLRDYAAYFWNHGFRISICETNDSIPGVELSPEALFEACTRFAQESIDLQNESWRGHEPDLADPVRSEVLGGLLARQTRLDADVALSPGIWNVDSGRILLRSMVDTRILLEWLVCCGEPEDFKSFVEYGVGQEKLYLEHAQAAIRDVQDPADWISEELADRRTWLEAQRVPDFLPLNLGSWSERSIREMAKDAGCAEL